MLKFKKLFKNRTFVKQILACALVLSIALPVSPASATDTGEPSFDNGYQTTDNDNGEGAAEEGVTNETDEDFVVVKKPVFNDKINYNLINFITGATLEGENITVNGNTWRVINPGVNYNMSLKFNENSTYQFSEDDSKMTYVLPDGVKAHGGGKINISVTYSGKTYTVKDNVFTVSDDGKTLSLTLNKNDDNLQVLNLATNATFTLKFEASFDLSEGNHEMDFGGNVKKNLEVKPSHNVSVEKSNEFDPATGELLYTINVKSTGTSENISVTDAMSGTVVGLRQDSISCNPAGVGFNITSKSDTGFSATIAKLTNQTATITYRASIKDASAVDANGAVTGGKNTVTVNTADDSNPNDNTATTPDDTYPVTSVLEKTGSVVSENGKPIVDGDGKVTINWSIKVNSERILPLNGKPITDTLSKDHKYSGSGITVIKTDKNGKSSSSDIAWAALNKTDTSFTYTPNDNTPYLYEIKYSTKTAAPYGKYSVANTVNYMGKDTKDTVDIGIPEGNDFQITKEIAPDGVDRTNGKISWIITMTIPAGGLPNLVLRDTYPHFKNPDNADETLYRDSLDESSLEVTGLVGEENYKKDDDISKRLKLTFYQDSAQKTKGLRGTGSKRTVTVKLTTKLNQQWLDYANTHITTGKQEQRHSNVAEAEINSKTVSDYARVYLADPEFKKSLDGGINWVNDSAGNTVPYYKYSLLFTNVTEDVVTIKDTLPDGFIFYTQPVGKEDITEIAKPDIVGGNSPLAMSHRSNGSVTFEDDKTIKVKVPKDEDDYYTYYQVIYYIIAKDTEAVKKLNQKAVDNGGTVTLTNKAEYSGVTDSADVTYTPDIGYYLWKSLDNESDLKDYQNVAKYSININHLGLKLNNGNNLTLTDTFENLDVDYTSIKFNPADACISYDVTGSKLTAILKDATPVIVTYSARVNGSGDVTFKNTADINGHSHDVSKTKTFNIYDAGSGSASILSMRIMKYEAGNMNKRLANVSFKLFKATKIDSESHLPIEGTEVKDINNKPVIVTTDADGIAVLDGNENKDGWELKAGETYYVVEEKALDGYEPDSTKYTFTISTDGTTDYNKFIYRNDDTLKIKNYKKVDHPLTIIKAMTGTIPEDIDLNDITIKVNDSNNKLITESTLANIKSNAEVGTTGYKYDQTSNKFEWTVAGLSDNQAVIVMETVNKTKEGYSLSKKYTVDGGSVNEYSESTGINAKAGQTVDLTNDYSRDKGRLIIKKTVETINTFGTVDESSLPTTFQFAVKNEAGNYIKDVNGTEGDKTPFYFTGISKNASLTINNLPTGKYVIEEKDARVNDLTLTATGLGEVTVKKGDPVTANVNNAYETPKKPEGNLVIEKKAGSADIPADKTFPISVKFSTGGSYSTNGVMTTYTTGEYKTFNIKAGEKITIESIPADITYDVKEELNGSDFGGYLTPSYNYGNPSKTIKDGKTDNVTVTNYYVAPTRSLTIEKKRAEASDEFPDTAKTFPVNVKFNKTGTFKVSVNEGTEKDLAVTDTSSYIEVAVLGVNDSVTITNIPDKTEYEVLEDISDTTKYDGFGEPVYTNKTGTLNSNQSVKVKITNSYTDPKKGKGNLQIVKTIVAPDSLNEASALSSIKFKITGTNTLYNKVITLGDFTKSSGKYIYNLKDITNDTYIVEETHSDVEGVEKKSVQYSIGSNGELVNGNKASDIVIKDNLAIVNFTDTYEEKEPEKGTLKIKKIFAGDKPSTDKMNNVTFTVTDNNGKTIKTLYYKDADDSGALTISELEPGTYTVTESQYNDDGKTITINTVVNVPEALAVNGTTDTVSVEIKSVKTSEVSFTNTYKEDGTTSEEPTSEQTTSEQTTSEQTTTAQPTTSQPTTSTEVTTQQPTTSVEIETEKKNVSTKKKTTESDDDDDDDEETEKGNLIITIHDEKTGKVVPGAKISVTSPNGKTKNYTTNNNGQVSIKNAQTGDYTLTVTDVPDGYTVTKNKELDVEVVKNKTTTAIVEINKDGGVSVTTKTTKSSAKTGDTFPVIPVVSAFMIAILGLVTLSFKKKQDN